MTMFELSEEGQKWLTSWKTFKQLPYCCVHPKYKGIRKPTSKAKACRCKEIYNKNKGNE